MSFRFFPPGAQLFTNDGLVLADGSITFADSGTTTPRDTWSDPTMTTLNPNPVGLDGAGRPDVDIWGDGSYRVTIKNSLGATIGSPLDNVSGPVGIPDPALQSGKFLTNDGTDVFWEAIEQVPDPTGQPDGNVLTTDGAGNVAWEAIPTVRQVPDPASIADGWVLTRDDASTGDYAWMAPASSVGMDQIWTTPLRVKDTDYTNSDTRAICANIDYDLANGSSIAFTIDGVTVASNSHTGSVTQSGFCSAIIPPGGVYRLTTTGSVVVVNWAELS